MTKRYCPQCGGINIDAFIQPMEGPAPILMVGAKCNECGYGGTRLVQYG